MKKFKKYSKQYKQHLIQLSIFMSIEINNKITNNEVLLQSKQELQDHKQLQRLLRLGKKYCFSKFIRHIFIFVCLLIKSYLKHYLL